MISIKCSKLTIIQAHYRTRLLRANLLQPLKDKNTIDTRLDCLVGFWKDQTSAQRDMS